MVRPLLPILWGIIGGILFEHYWSVMTHINTFYVRSGSRLPDLTIYFALLGICYLCYRLNFLRLATFSLVLLAIVIGMARYAGHRHLPAHHISHFVQDEYVTIEGALYKPPEPTPIFSQSSFNRKQQYLYINTTWLEQGRQRYRVCGKVRILLGGGTIPLAQTKVFSYGDQMRMRLRLHLPNNSENVNRREFLRLQGIYLVGTLRHDRYIIKLSGHQGNPLLTWVYMLQRRMLQMLDQYASTRSHGTSQAIQVMKAMTLGTNHELSPELKDAFRNSGMYHILVVSGIHIGILTWVLHHMLSMLYIPLRYRSMFLAMLLLLYAGLTGFHFPVLRAVIMVLTFYFASVCNRLSDPIYSLAFAVAGILFVFPTSLFEISFQMTVAATLSILLFFQCIQSRTWFGYIMQLPWMLRIPAMAFFATFGALIGVSPLILYYFESLPLYSLLSNPVAVFLVTPLLPSGLLANVIALLTSCWNAIFPFLTFLFSINTFLTKCLIAFASIFPQPQFALSRPSLWMLWLYYGVIYYLFSFYKN